MRLVREGSGGNRGKGSREGKGGEERRLKRRR
jgi:hypothetical protein